MNISKFITLLCVVGMFFVYSLAANADSSHRSDTVKAKVNAPIDVSTVASSDNTNNLDNSISIQHPVAPGNGSDKIEAEPAIAPSIFGGVSNLTCFANVGGSAAAGGAVSLGLLTTKEDKQCTCRANLSYVSGLAKHNLVTNEQLLAYAQNCLTGLKEAMGIPEPVASKPMPHPATHFK